MTRYIELDTLVTKIDNLKHKIDDRYSYSNGWKDALRMLEAELDTLKVKEVDLEEEISKELRRVWYGEYLDLEKFEKSAKHFFELGMAVRNKAQKGE